MIFIFQFYAWILNKNKQSGLCHQHFQSVTYNSVHTQFNVLSCPTAQNKINYSIVCRNFDPCFVHIKSTTQLCTESMIYVDYSSNKVLTQKEMYFTSDVPTSRNSRISDHICNRLFNKTDDITIVSNLLKIFQQYTFDNEINLQF